MRSCYFKCHIDIVIICANKAHCHLILTCFCVNYAEFCLFSLLIYYVLHRVESKFVNNWVFPTTHWMPVRCKTLTCYLGRGLGSFKKMNQTCLACIMGSIKHVKNRKRERTAREREEGKRKQPNNSFRIGKCILHPRISLWFLHSRSYYLILSWLLVWSSFSLARK